MTDTPGQSPDPAGFLNPPQQLLKVINTARADLNGQIGSALSYNPERQRYTIQIQLSPSTNHSALSFKVENLCKASMLEKAKFRLGEAKSTATRFQNDPQIREEMRRTYTSIQNRLPPAVKPEYLAVALVVLICICIRTFGFSKTMLILSLMSMPVATCAPDIRAGMSPVQALRNFPRRWRDNVAHTTGYHSVSEKLALAGFALLLLLSFKIVMTSSPKAAVKVAETVRMASNPTSRIATPKLDVEAIYKAGFEDASGGKDFGASMPDSSTVVINTTPQGYVGSAADDLSWDYDPIAPPPTKSFMSKMGMGTMFSLFGLANILKELAMDPGGRFNPQLFLLNLRNMPLQKMAMLGFCLYRIGSLFM